MVSKQSDDLNVMGEASADSGVEQALYQVLVDFLQTASKTTLERIQNVNGMTSREVAAMIAVQTLVLGLLAGLFALPLGLMMSDILIDVINRRSFGWSMQHTLPPNVLIEALLLAIGAALIAGLYPMRRVARVRPAEAVRGD